MLKQIAYFLLNVPPLDELTDDLAEVVEKYRYKMISKNEALKILLSDHREVLQNLLDENLSLNGLT
jgi:dsDNA-binding SOS-regulon protein